MNGEDVERVRGGIWGSMWDELAVCEGHEGLMRTWGVNKEELLVTPRQAPPHIIHLHSTSLVTSSESGPV